MSKEPDIKLKRNVQPINRGLIVGLTVLVVVTISVGRGVIASEPFILGTFVVGSAAASLGWNWDIRWKQLFYTLGVLMLGYSMAAMFLTAQYWLLLVAFVLAMLFIGMPALYKLNKQIERDRLR